MAPAKRQPFQFGALWRNFWNGGRDFKLGEKSEYGVWAETLNPLRGISERALQDIFDAARAGVYAQLAYIYQEIEAADPILLTVAERRESAAGAPDWKITTSNPERTAGFDEALAQEQQDHLYKAYGRAGDSIGQLAEHLEGAFFRGFAHARPVLEAGAVAGFETFDAWNFALDKSTGQWWWNPDASTIYNDNFTPIPDGELITLTRQRHINYPALAIYIRTALGDRRYGVFLERYGVPPVSVIMPEFANEEDKAAYMDAAHKFALGGSGALPYGSQVEYATGARGTNPFTEFLRHQHELIVIMATGGTLTTLASPTGIGGGASDVQDAAWRSITARDTRAAGRAINRTVTRRLLAARFPGRPPLAQFEFDPEPAPTAEQVFKDAAAARQGGYRIAQKDLEDATGYTLEPDPAAPPDGSQGGFPPLPPLQNKATPRNPVANPLQIAHNAPEGKTDGDGGGQAAPPENSEKTAPNAKPPSGDGDTAALAADLAPLAARLAAALDLPDAEMLPALDALRAEAPDIFRRLDEGGHYTAALEEKLARAFAAGLSPEPPLQNKAEKCPDCGQWLSGDGTCTVCRGSDETGANPDGSEKQAAEIGKGKAALQRCLEEKADVYDAVHRSDIGGIGFVYGDEKAGIAHFSNREDAVRHLPETLVRGKKSEAYENGRKIDLNLGGYQAVIRMDRNQKSERWVLTSFGPEDKKGGD